MICDMYPQYWTTGIWGYISQFVALNLIMNTNILNQDSAKCPKIIRDEYEILLDMLENEEYYGALLQAKDVLELSLKLPIVILLSGMETYILSKDIETNILRKKYPYAISILEDILSKPLSFGDWEIIAKKIGDRKNIHQINDIPLFEKERPLYNIFLNIIQKTYSFYYNFKDPELGNVTVSTWRNRKIGHGAINVDKKALSLEIIPIIGRVKQIIHNMDYSPVQIFKSDRGLKVRLLESRCEISIDPYVSGFAYVFESFNKKKKISYILDYITGNKKENKELFQRLDRLTEKLNIKEYPDKFIYKDVALKEDVENILTYNTKFTNYILQNNLQRILREYKGGIFLVATNKRMGKSSYVFSIGHNTNKFNANNVLNKSNTICFSYIINQNLKDNFYIFWKEFNDFLLSNVYNSLDLSKARFDAERVIFNKDTDIIEKQQKINKYLSIIKNIYSKIFGKTYKIVVSIDGIDENETKFVDLVNLLLNSKEDALYVVLYCSINKGKNDKILSIINFTSKFIVERDEKSYEEMLEKYVLQAFSVDKFKAKEILKISKMDWGNIYFFYSIYKMNRTKFFNMLSRKESLCNIYSELLDIFFEQLESISSKYVKEAKKFIMGLSFYGFPLTIKEINELIFNQPAEMVTYKLLGLTKDLANFLDISITLEGDYAYSINKNWETAIDFLYETEIVKEEAFFNLLRNTADDKYSALKNLIFISKNACYNVRKGINLKSGNILENGEPWTDCELYELLHLIVNHVENIVESDFIRMELLYLCIDEIAIFLDSLKCKYKFTNTELLLYSKFISIFADICNNKKENGRALYYYKKTECILNNINEYNYITLNIREKIADYLYYIGMYEEAKTRYMEIQILAYKRGDSDYCTDYNESNELMLLVIKNRFKMMLIQITTNSSIDNYKTLMLDIKNIIYDFSVELDEIWRRKFLENIFKTFNYIIDEFEIKEKTITIKLEMFELLKNIIEIYDYFYNKCDIKLEITYYIRGCVLVCKLFNHITKNTHLKYEEGNILDIVNIICENGLKHLKKSDLKKVDSVTYDGLNFILHYYKMLISLSMENYEAIIVNNDILLFLLCKMTVECKTKYNISDLIYGDTIWTIRGYSYSQLGLLNSSQNCMVLSKISSTAFLKTLI